MTAPPAGDWRPDPTGRHELRWFDGAGWTDQVADGGATAVDPFEAASTEPPATPPPAAPTAPEATGGRSKLPIVAAAVVVAVLIGVAVTVLGGGDDGLDDEALEDLADQVLDDLDLPGDEIEDLGGDAFSIDCLVEEADLDRDTVVEDVGPVARTSDFDDDEGFFQLGVALHVLAEGTDVDALLDAAPEDDTITCFAEAEGFDEGTEIEVDDAQVEIGGDEALFVTSTELDFVRTYLVVGRVLVNVQAFAEDDDQREELVVDALAEAQEALRDGGA